MSVPRDYLNFSEAARVMGVQPETIKNWVKDGTIYVVQFRGQRRIPRYEVIRLLRIQVADHRRELMSDDEPAEERAIYNMVVAVQTGVTVGMNETTIEAFTAINMDMTVIMEDGTEVLGRFLLPDAEAAEQVATSLVRAAADWRDKVGIPRG